MENHILNQDKTRHSDNTFNGYPDYEDHDFNEKISRKKEFYINKIPERERDLSDEDLEIKRNKLCNPLYNVDESDKGDVELSLIHI